MGINGCVHIVEGGRDQAEHPKDYVDPSREIGLVSKPQHDKI